MGDAALHMGLFEQLAQKNTFISIAVLKSRL
jgi:hypothetical protein